MNTLTELLRDSFYSIIFHVAPRFAGVLLFILIGRLAGPSEAGVFSLATTYLLIFTTVMRGLDDLVIRQVSREPHQAPPYLTNFLLIRLGLSLILYGVLVFVVEALFDYAANTRASILILALSLIPDSLTYVAQAVLLGQRRFGAPAITWASASLFKLVGGGLLLVGGGNLLQIAWVWLAGSLLGMVALLAVLITRIGRLRWVDWLNWQPLARNWHAALPFLFATTMAALEAQVDTVLLSAFHAEAEIGWYGAATTVAFSLLIFSQAYRFSVYPLMARYAIQSTENLSRLYERSMRYMGVFVLPMVGGIALLSSQIVSLLFGPGFEQTNRVLGILALALIPIFLNEPTVRIMLVHDRQRRVFLFLLVSAGTNVALNLALVPSLGASGAAVSRLCSSLAYFLLNYSYVTAFLMRLNIVRLLYRPVLATLIMAFVVWLARATVLPVSIGVGAVMYIGSLWFVGGILPSDAMLLRRIVTSRLKTGENGLLH